MKVTIRKIGNSDGVIIPKDVLQGLGLKTEDTLQLKAEDGKIKLTPMGTDLSRQREAARIGMQKYKIALRELAK